MPRPSKVESERSGPADAATDDRRRRRGHPVSIAIFAYSHDQALLPPSWADVRPPTPAASPTSSSPRAAGAPPIVYRPVGHLVTRLRDIVAARFVGLVGHRSSRTTRTAAIFDPLPRQSAGRAMTRGPNPLEAKAIRRGPHSSVGRFAVSSTKSMQNRLDIHA